MKKQPKVRTTITIDPTVLEVYKRMAKASRMSTSTCLGEWLADTADGALGIAMQCEKARTEPLKAMHDLQLYAQAMQEEAQLLVQDIQARRGGVASAKSADLRSAAAHLSPSSNTGGNEIQQNRGGGGK